ncbi:MAG TPA: hypothetical protein VI434_04820 [Candidatus Dormibacteraeota bacterium]
MIPTRAVLAIPAAVLVLSGCGAISTVQLRASGEGIAYADATHALPRPDVTPVAIPPASTGSTNPFVVTVQETGSNQLLEIVSGSGTVVAKTTIDPPSPWLTAAGAGGAYWTQGGAEHELTTSGVVRTLGAVPADANGVVISPDGTSYAYTTSEQLKNGTALNRIFVVRPDAAAVVIADRISDPNHPTSDAPESWDYYLIDWSADGIAFARVLTGGCGCGSFDMQMQSANTAIINPTTEVVTALTNDDSCPLSNVGPGTETVCFASSENTGATEGVRIGAGGVVTHNYSLSGTTVAGDAVFAPNGDELAYITIPLSQDTCGATITPTLRILNTSTGSASDRNIGDFAPALWGSNGLIYGTMSAGENSWVVTVNPVTFAVTHVGGSLRGTAFIGMV